jgi:dnd system-associated protein 4
MKMTIVDAAQKAISTLGGMPSLVEIYDTILSLNLYTFNTDQPQHVLRTQIHRYCDNVERVDKSESPIFRRIGADNYVMISDKKSSGIRRIHRAKDKEATIKALVEDLGAFKEIWRVLLFAAMLGVKAQRREKLCEIDSGRGIDQSTFGNCSSWPGVLHLLALVEAQDAAVLSDASEEGRIALFEEYANGGLSIIADHLATSSLSLQSLIDLADRFGQAPKATDLRVDLAI